MKTILDEETIRTRRCFLMAKNKGKKSNQVRKQEETDTGYGNKKLEGPDRPST
jgi:hypothetical protein